MAIINLKKATSKQISRLAKIRHIKVREALTKLERFELITVEIERAECLYSVNWRKLLPIILHGQAEWLWAFETEHFLRPKRSVVKRRKLEKLIARLENNIYLRTLYETYISSYKELSFDLEFKKSLYDLLVTDFFDLLPRYYNELAMGLKIEIGKEYARFKKFIDVAYQTSTHVDTIEGAAFKDAIQSPDWILESTVISLLEENRLQIQREITVHDYRYDALVRTGNKTFGIEIKAHKNPIPAEVIRSLAIKSEILDGMIVISPSGFTSAAVEAARSHDIKLVTIEQINELIDELKQGTLLTRKVVSPVSATPMVETLKDVFKRALARVKSASTNEEKKQSLEDLAECLIKPISGLAVLSRNKRSLAEETDIMVKNESTEPFWTRLGSPILVECRHWSLPTGAKEIRDLFAKLESFGIITGVAVTLRGITGNEYRDAKMLIREYRQKGKYIIVLNEGDLAEIADGVDPSDKIRERYYDIFLI